MPTLWKIPEKMKATLVLVAKIVASLNTVTSALVKIFDDSELSLEEAIGFGTGPAADVVGNWRGVNSPAE